MYERFTDRSRKVMQLANEEAQPSKNHCLGTEHILLGLVEEGEGVAAHVLAELGADLGKIRFQVENVVTDSASERQWTYQPIRGQKPARRPAWKAVVQSIRQMGRMLPKDARTEPPMVKTVKFPQTPQAKRVIDYAMEEVRKLNHNYVGTEHLLLGLLRVYEGVAAQVLINLGFQLEDIRKKVLDILGVRE